MLFLLNQPNAKLLNTEYRNLKAIDVDILNNTISQKLSSVQLIQDVDTPDTSKSLQQCYD